VAQKLLLNQYRYDPGLLGEPKGGSNGEGKLSKDNHHRNTHSSSNHFRLRPGPKSKRVLRRKRNRQKS